MAKASSGPATAWSMFDEIVGAVDTSDRATSPWRDDGSGGLVYEADIDTLRQLLAVPLELDSQSTSGLPALALDVWIAHELRRAGLNPDAVWPRATEPRVMPVQVARLLENLPSKESEDLRRRLGKSGGGSGVVASSATVLGKNYVKQVDVVMSDWRTGPELLISTKRMDSSFNKNAANRVEESYGDAKNLRLRYPMAGLGFFFGLRSTAFDLEPEKAAWIIDLLIKLGREDDAYHAVGLLVMDYDDPGSTASGGKPRVDFLQDLVPPALQPSAFLGRLVTRLLENTPIDFHVEARARRSYVLLP